MGDRFEGGAPYGESGAARTRAAGGPCHDGDVGDGLDEVGEVLAGRREVERVEREEELVGGVRLGVLGLGLGLGFGLGLGLGIGIGLGLGSGSGSGLEG